MFSQAQAAGVICSHKYPRLSSWTLGLQCSFSPTRCLPDNFSKQFPKVTSEMLSGRQFISWRLCSERQRLWLTRESCNARSETQWRDMGIRKCWVWISFHPSSLATKARKTVRNEYLSQQRLNYRRSFTNTTGSVQYLGSANSHVLMIHAINAPW